MDHLDDKRYIKEELNKEKYDRMMLKLIVEVRECMKNWLNVGFHFEPE